MCCPNPTLSRPSPIDPALFGTIYEQAHSNAQEKIQHLSDRLKGFPQHSYLRHGTVSDVMSEIIREQQIDLLVAGTHGRTGLGKLVLGSVAEELFRQASCPVLTIGPKVAALDRVREERHHHVVPPVQVKLHKILYATDLEHHAADGVSYAFSLARQFRAQLTLLHVIENYGDLLQQHPGPIDVALSGLQKLVPDQEGLLYRPEFMAEYGSPAEVILRTAAENDIDLIVLGVRPDAKHLSAAIHLSGSIAHKVVVGAECPVLTVGA